MLLAARPRTYPRLPPPRSIWWQFIPYFLLGASEVFTNVGVMELFYTQASRALEQRLLGRGRLECAWGPAGHAVRVASSTHLDAAVHSHTHKHTRTRAHTLPPQVSEGMRAIGTSMYLLTVALGTYMATALNLIIAAAFPRDLWVSGERGGRRTSRPPLAHGRPACVCASRPVGALGAASHVSPHCSTGCTIFKPAPPRPPGPPPRLNVPQTTPSLATMTTCVPPGGLPGPPAAL